MYSLTLHDLDLDSVTLILDHDVDVLKMCLRIKNEGQGFQKLQPNRKHTYIWTDRQTDRQTAMTEHTRGWYSEDGAVLI